MHREGALLLGGGRALIMQVAHPLVAAGVGEHSRYREQPWGRLFRTLDLYTTVIFGTQVEVEAVGRRLWGVHGRVRGVLGEGGGRYEVGTPYAARDPALLMWVHATLVDTALVVYERFLGQLGARDRARYYEEQKVLGERFGLPLDRQPAKLGDLGDYVQDMLRSDALATTSVLRDVADSVLHPPLPSLARPAVELVNLATVGLLPTRLRRDLNLRWGPAHELVLAGSRQALRAAIPFLPSFARTFPRARRAEARVRSRPPTP